MTLSYNMTRMSSRKYIFIGILLVIGTLLSGSALAEYQPPSTHIRSAWYHWDPYQYQIKDNKTNLTILTGLDVKLVNAIFKRMGTTVDYVPLAWKKHQEAVKNGQRDIAAGAFHSKERTKYAYYSDEYRKEVNVLYVPKGESTNYPFNGQTQMLKYFKQHKFKLGAVKGYVYADAALNKYINDPNNKDLIIFTKNEVANFKNLQTGKINGFVVDRIAGATIAWRNGWQNQVEEHPGFYAKNSIYLLISKKNFSPQFIKKINNTIKQMKKDGSYQKIIKNYMLPVMLNITIEKEWFFILELLGTIAFAMSGLIIAFKERYSIIGAFVLAALPALGGGVIRDLLVDRRLNIFRSPIYIELVILLVVIGFVLIKPFQIINKRLQCPQIFKIGFGRLPWLSVFDAIGLSAFTVLGVVIAVESKLEPLILWGPIIAMVTSFAGGLVRDTIRQKGTIETLSKEFYGEVSLIWGFLFSLFIEWEALRLNLNEVLIGVMITVLGAFITRMLVIRFKIKGFLVTLRLPSAKI